MDPQELYLRQGNPRFTDRDAISWQAFRATEKDDGKLSGARDSKQTPVGAFEERNQHKPGSTAGTWGVSLEEVEQLKSRLVDDSSCPPPPEYSSWPLGHAYLDQRAFDKDGRKQLRLNLAGAATRRGRLYPPQA
jgi:hypothetical protein